MRIWVFLLIPLAPLFSNEILTAVTENVPSTLVDEEDRVAGVERLPIRRFDLSALGGINIPAEKPVDGSIPPPAEAGSAVAGNEPGLVVPLISENITYNWGTGYFKDISDIRRKVYTTYYTLQEEGSLLKMILGYIPEEYLRQVLAEIEDPGFDIDSKKYEEIKAYIWERSRETFVSEISEWEQVKDVCVVEEAEKLLKAAESDLDLWAVTGDTPKMWRGAILMTSALDLFDITKKGDLDAILHEIKTMLDSEGEPAGIHIPIDFSDELVSNLVERPGGVVVLPGNINNLAFSLKLYGESLLLRWLSILGDETGFVGDDLIKEARRRGIGVTFAVNAKFVPRNNNQIVQFNATRRNVEDLVKLPQFQRLRDLMSSGLFNIEAFESRFPGTVLTDLSDSVRKSICAAERVIALGEQNIITLDGLMSECYRIAPIRDFSNIFYTGIKYNKESFKYPSFSVLYAPRGVASAIDYVPDLPTHLSAFQFYLLYRTLPKDTWRRLIEKTRDVKDGNILDVAQTSSLLSSSEKDAIAKIIGPRDNDRIDAVRDILKIFGGTYSRVEGPSDNRKQSVMHVLHFPEAAQNGRGESLNIGVSFAGEYLDYNRRPKSKMLFEDLAASHDKAVLAFNFLYFITRNLLEYFNHSNPHFRLGDCFFGQSIDILMQGEGKEKILYPPLYNKGAIGKDASGRLIFGRIRIPQTGCVTIPLGMAKRRFTWTTVNPMTVDFDDPPALFTPFEDSYRDSGKKAPHVKGETRDMYFMPENDRYNFVMINDKLLGVVRGRTEIPPFGTILSVPSSAFSPDEREALDKETALVSDERKKWVNEFVEVKFEFSLPDQWKTAEWIMGGALLMVDDGRIEDLNCEQTHANTSIYGIEGWNLHSSQRTQETPVETDLREARTTIGCTYDGELFLIVIEGRANNRSGANHEETVDMLRRYFADRGKTIRYALDLDSASSVAVGFIRNGKFYLLNQTARGSDSKLNDTRYYNHIAYFEKVEL